VLTLRPSIFELLRRRVLVNPFVASNGSSG
jgi:hypothetical protein